MAARMFGIDQKQAKGRYLHEAIRSGDLYKFIKKIENGTFIEEEIVLSLSGAEGRVLQIHGNAIYDAENTRIGILIVLNDITRLKKLETIRRDFVANVSHELRTPLTSIKGFVETLREGAKDNPDELDRFLEIISNQVNRLNSIISDLLSLSKIEEHVQQKRIVLETTVLTPVIKEALEVCERAAREKNIVLDLDQRENITANINILLLEQALINLVQNAVKYSPENTKVTITARKERQTVFISVTDQGFGINKEHFPRLFERFYRIDKARSRKQGGTGLGLAIVKHIMEAHLGTVRVASEPGKGSTFTLAFPA
jgi:two-component system phosphate regulon sensor histidine kinase PhoR